MAEKEITSEQREEMAKIAKANLGSALWDYATPKLLTPEAYGGIAKAGEGFYQKAISQTPDQSIYEQLFLPQLAKEDGAITSPYIQNTSLAILQNSLFSVKVKDLMKQVGAKGEVPEGIGDKYVSQLDEEQAGQLVGSVIQYKADDVAKKVLSERQKAVAGGLEELVGVKEKPKE